MITQEQIEKHCKQNSNLRYSKLLFATLDRDYQIGNCITPIKTIVQVMLYKTTLADLYINGECVDASFPYDAATLLENEA